MRKYFLYTLIYFSSWGVPGGGGGGGPYDSFLKIRKIIIKKNFKEFFGIFWNFLFLTE